MPEPHVAGAVAHAEDPAVARQQPLPVPQVQPRLEVVVVVPRARVVGADGDAERPVVALAQPHRQRQPGRIPIRRDDHPGPVAAFRLAGRQPVDRAVTPAMRPCASSTGPGHGHALEEPRARLLRRAGEDLVEVEPGPDQPVAGIAGQFGPGQLEPDPAADDPQALVPDPAVLLADRHAHADQGLDRAGGEAVAADLLPREVSLLQHQHVHPGPGQVGGGGRAGPAPTTMTSASCGGPGGFQACAGAPPGAAGPRQRAGDWGGLRGSRKVVLTIL